MKLITAIIKPFKLDDVKDALKGAGVAGHDRHRGAGLRPPGAATPRCTGAPSTRSTSCPRSASRSSSTTADVDAVVDAIVDAARTGKIGDGKVWVTRCRAASSGSAPARRDADAL